MTIESRFLVGIDLGTSNSALFYIDQEDLKQQLHHFSIPQWIDAGQWHEHPTLASNLYLLTEEETASGQFQLPWQKESPDYVVGQWARQQQALKAGRNISSVKSWLCYHGIDPHSSFLPQSELVQLSRRSPIATTAAYLAHLKDAWNAHFAKENPEFRLEEQDIVVTVPASFDEAGREYTVEAIRASGLQHFTLLEEPQAAFYSWIASTPPESLASLEEEQLVLVVDIGGGTSDFSLIHMSPGEKFERVAVSDHILLGGDNIDLTLANRLEPQLAKDGKKLSPQLWEALVSQCHQAKENLLSGQQEKVTITIAQSGRQLLGRTKSVVLTRSDVDEIVLEGFFPLVSWNDVNIAPRNKGLRQLGLPYAQEPAVTRHLCNFLKQYFLEHGETARMPDGLLFNGGMLTPEILKTRLGTQLDQWHLEKDSSSSIATEILEAPNLHLAVARGAAYYQLARRGKGVRIAGGSARSFYVELLVQNAKDSVETHWLCVLPQNATLENALVIADTEFSLSINQTIQFRLISSIHRPHDTVGEIFDFSKEEMEEQFVQLPPIQTFLRMDRKNISRKTKEIAVKLRATLNEIGTLSLTCVASQFSDEWKLEFRIHDQVETAPDSPSQLSVDEDNRQAFPEVWNDGLQLARQWFGKRPRSQSKQEIRTFNSYRLLEEVLRLERNDWPLPLLRALWDQTFEGESFRVRSPHHELNWVRMSGFCLRPGFGSPGDEGRTQQLSQLLAEGLHFKNERQIEIEWWIMWRRIAAGLSAPIQKQLFETIRSKLAPSAPVKKKSGTSRHRSAKKKGKATSQPDSSTLNEVWRLAASLEDLPADTKVELGQMLIKQVDSNQVFGFEGWCLARLGARVPLFGKPIHTVPIRVVETWIDWLLNHKALPFQTNLPLILCKLGQITEDRNRDIAEAKQADILAFLHKQKDGDDWERMLKGQGTEGQDNPVSDDWLFGDSLPTGLKLIKK